jgi:NADPH:quinone reductase-like Zn-dependent oxidoreductase
VRYRRLRASVKLVNSHKVMEVLHMRAIVLIAIERDRQEAERRGFPKIVFMIDFERAQESMREITNLVDSGSVHVPSIHVLPLEDAIRAHQMIETGHVRGKIGGDDGARTRDLRRDRFAFRPRQIIDLPLLSVA